MAQMTKNVRKWMVYFFELARGSTAANGYAVATIFKTQLQSGNPNPV